MSKSSEKLNNGIWVDQSYITDLKLKGNELLVYSYIASFKNKTCYAKLDTIAKFLNITKIATCQIIDKLVKKDLIQKETISYNKNIYSVKESLTPMLKKVKHNVKENITPMLNNFKHNVKESLTPTNNKYTINRDNKYTIKENADAFPEEVGAFAPLPIYSLPCVKFSWKSEHEWNQTSTTFDISQDMLIEYKKTYKNCDVDEQFKLMIDWLQTNKPKQDKKMEKFINDWLSKNNTQKPLSVAERARKILERMPVDENGELI